MNDFLCIVEAEGCDWEWVRDWLEKKKERRVAFIDSPPTLDHPRIKFHSIESPLLIEFLARQIAWDAVFLQLEIRGGKSETGKRFCKELKKFHLAANLLLSDASDWGCSLAKHAVLRRCRPVRQGLKLSKAFPNMPAIVVGAGPSLEKNAHLLESFRDRALILAGGSALNAIRIEPHFAASIDKEAPFREFKRHPFSETPFCFQSRMNPDNFSLIHGEALLFPDSHFLFLDEGKGFDGGWTVGTFLTALATLMGCNPIVFIGMDYCYHEGRKYAGREDGGQISLVETSSRDGSRVWTQPDWLMARFWLEEWASKHPNLRFFNATEGGLGFSFPIQEIRLSDLRLEKRGDLRHQVHNIVAALPWAAPLQWGAWKESLERCGRIAESALFGGEEEFDGERAYELLLLPLWRTWSPFFSRALEFDPHPDKLKINQLLFFQQVIQEHLRAIE